MTLLPTPPRTPYGLRLVTSSDEYANESIEFDEGVSEGTLVGANVCLEGKTGGKPPCVGDSGGVRGSVCFAEAYLLISCRARSLAHYSLLRPAVPGAELAYFLPVPIDLLEPAAVSSRRCDGPICAASRPCQGQAVRPSLQGPFVLSRREDRRHRGRVAPSWPIW